MERKIVEFSEGEFVVRSYQCSLQKPVLSQASDGYLQVTNKRVIYANSTKSGGSGNLLVSEVPLEDVGSISSFVGRSLNILGLLPFVILLTLIANVADDILPQFMTHWFFGFLLMLPFIIIWLMEKNFLNQDLFDRILKNLEIEKESQRSIATPGETLRKVLKIVFIIGVVLIIASIMKNYAFAGYFNLNGIIQRFLIPLAVFSYIYISVFGFQHEFGLFVSAKSSSGSGLTIKSNSFQSLFGKKSMLAPGKIIPTVDSYTVAKELGALVMDLQQAGDLAIEKWSERQTSFATSD